MQFLQQPRRPQFKEKISKSNSYTCTHYGEVGHSKERCYEIVGYPEWWDFNKNSRKKLGKAVIATFSITKISRDPDETLGMSNLTWNDTQIIDTGATDHMTNSTSHLTSICPATQQNILTANGGITLVTHEGSVSNSNSLNLDTVLVVPSLSCNLLSVG